MNLKILISLPDVTTLEAEPENVKLFLTQKYSGETQKRVCHQKQHWVNFQVNV